MPNYRRIKIEGARFFFTVCLADRRATTLVDHIAQSRVHRLLSMV
jgi:hypothetical protein